MAGATDQASWVSILGDSMAMKIGSRAQSKCTACHKDFVRIWFKMPWHPLGVPGKHGCGKGCLIHACLFSYHLDGWMAVLEACFQHIHNEEWEYSV